MSTMGGILLLLARDWLYLDPGSGSYLLQLLIAGVMGSLLLLKVYWSKVTSAVRRLLGKEVDEGDG